MINDNDQFCFSDNDKYGIPAIKIDGEIFSISYDFLKDFSAEFYGKVMENQMAIAGGDEEVDNEWVVVFMPDAETGLEDAFNRRRAFKAALESFRKIK